VWSALGVSLIRKKLSDGLDIACPSLAVEAFLVGASFCAASTTFLVEQAADSLKACLPKPELLIASSKGRGEGPFAFGDPGQRCLAPSARGLSKETFVLISGWVETSGACMP
jgi:hypothetical protein